MTGSSGSGAPAASPSRSLRIACDFDGTITCEDTVNVILQRYARPEWLEIEAEWCAGRIGSRECLARQTELLHISPTDLNGFLDAVEVDPDAADFLREAEAAGHHVSVVSDGWDWAVRRVLVRMGLGHLRVVSNRLAFVGGDRWRLFSPHAAAGCGSGVCKCRASGAGGFSVHIGDGRSDFCAAEAADLALAKGALARRLAERRIPHDRFAGFADLRPILAGLPERAERAAGERRRPA